MYAACFLYDTDGNLISSNEHTDSPRIHLDPPSCTSDIFMQNFCSIRLSSNLPARWRWGDTLFPGSVACIRKP